MKEITKESELKAEEIALAVASGMPYGQIAAEIGITLEGLKRILRSVDYLSIEYRVRQGRVNELRERFKKRVAMELELESLLPDAMKVLAEHVRTKRDLRAAIEVFERDPNHQFSKISRTEIKETQQPSISPEAFASALKDAERAHKLMAENSETKQ